MWPFTIAVVSDLHIGSGARAKDLCPYPDTKAIDHAYISNFESFLRKNHIAADLLVVPGDITNGAQPDEFDLASGFISNVAAWLNVAPDHILSVPGNHDVDWQVLKLPDASGFRSQQRYASLSADRWIFGRIMHTPESLLLPPYIRVWEFDDIVAVGYNSSWHDDPNIVLHHGLVSQEHVDALADRLNHINLSPNRIRLFIVHHHPVLYSEPIADTTDFSAMTNSDNLLRLLRAHSFDLLIHGHKHAPHFHTHIVDGGVPLAVLGAGSFSAMLDTRWSGHVSNQFHLVVLETRDSTSGFVQGHVQSWSYLCGSGWIKSEPYTGIRHRLPFGAHLHPEALKDTLRPVLAVRLAERDYLHWQVVVEVAPSLQFVPPDTMMLAVRAVCQEMGFRPFGHLPDELIILRDP